MSPYLRGQIEIPTDGPIGALSRFQVVSGRGLRQGEGCGWVFGEERIPGDGYEVILDVPPSRRDDFDGPAMSPSGRKNGNRHFCHYRVGL